ncbi:uncharacterized protein LOC131255836 isoform X3 [Magnolia sinica]|uniref:uncharacterized protein LOC131255836 isoform X3 n=1 Tax=Magnolia sinica TaxID=86752 RepID=UPI00265A3DD8|nr:uncharacterized protein LOC131255836 isoform X3 [Magnolia sinica]
MVEYQNILGLLEAHVELQPLLLKSHDRLKDLLFLDIALDSTVRTTVERGYEELNNVEPERCLLPIKTNSRALIAFLRFRNYKRSYKRRSTCILLWQILLLKLLHLCLILLLRFPPRLRSCCLTKMCSRSQF